MKSCKNMALCSRKASRKQFHFLKNSKKEKRGTKKVFSEHVIGMPSLEAF
jgi:hypothetical protein